MSYFITVEVQCDDCGRSMVGYRGSFANKTVARSAAREAGWQYHREGPLHICPECQEKDRFILEEEK